NGLLRSGRLLRRGGEVGAHALHRLAHIAAHAVGDDAHRVAEAILDSVEFARALLDFGTAGGGDLVDRRAALLMLGREALVFELRQTRVDGAGARRGGATRALGERLDDAVTVERTVGEETQK